jgi:hypothetical protein
MTRDDYLARLAILSRQTETAINARELDTAWLLFAEIFQTMLTHGPRHLDNPVQRLAKEAEASVGDIQRLLDELRKRGLRVETVQ